MKNKVKVKIPAKINLTLDVFNGENNYHNINSLVASVEIFDAICLERRTDDKITLKEKGIKTNLPIEQNNAYKTYALLKEKYNLSGANIIINKKIPIGAGLGGSSADVAGIMKCVEKLYDINIDRKNISEKLGSDVMYMLEGGFSVLSGRGNNVNKLCVDKSLYINVIDNNAEVLAKDVYALFDKLELTSKKSTERATKSLIDGDENFYNFLSNDLTIPAIKIVPVISESLEKFKLAKAKFMTGSGSATIGVYLTKKQRDEEYKNLKKQGLNVIKTKTTKNT